MFPVKGVNVNCLPPFLRDKKKFKSKIKKETKKMNLNKIEKNLENRFNKYPDWLQIILMVSFYPVLCTIGLITLAGWFVVIDFLVRG